MIKIKNICNEVGVGAFYYSSTSHTLPYEPYIEGIQLKLDETLHITLDTYVRLKEYLEDLRTHKIISFTDPVKVLDEEITTKEEPNKVLKDKVSEPKLVEKLSLEEVTKVEDKIEELTSMVEAAPTVEDVFKKTKRKK
jgi:hypothetical protein